ncbi:hypothetical protein GCM10008968_05120 [Bacillus horti]
MEKPLGGLCYESYFPETFDINDKTSFVLDENEKLQVKEHITKLFNELSKNK